MKSAKAREADIIIYSANMSTETSRFVSRFVKLAQKVSKNQNVKIVIMDRAVLFGNLHAEAIGAYARGVSPADINAFALNADKHPTITDEINSSLSEAGELDNVTIVSNRRLQCSESSCDFFTDEGDLANWDNSHWTLKGSKIFMSRFIDQYPLLFQ